MLHFNAKFIAKYKTNYLISIQTTKTFARFYSRMGIFICPLGHCKILITTTQPNKKNLDKMSLPEIFLDRLYLQGLPYILEQFSIIKDFKIIPIYMMDPISSESAKREPFIVKVKDF